MRSASCANCRSRCRALLGSSGQRSVDITENGGLITLTPSDAALTARIRQAVDQSIQIIERRVNELGLVEPTIQREGADRILVQVPGLQDPSRLKEILGKTAKLDFRMVDQSMSAGAGDGRRVRRRIQNFSMARAARNISSRSACWFPAPIWSTPSPASTSATASRSSASASIRTGARKFAEATRENVGKPFAIVLDNKVISAPVIREPILGGSGQISGNFTVQQANDLAILLRAGALPAPLTVIEERTVGPGLGQDFDQCG